MGKRTKEKSEDEIKRKIRRLENELKDREARSRTEQNELEDEEDYYSQDLRESTTEPGTLAGSDEEDFPDHSSNDQPLQTEPEIALTHADNEDTLPSEIIAVLGEAKKLEESLGKKIPPEVSNRWQKILIDGLAKEQKESLLTKILIPENFQLAKAPKLNAEVASVVNDATKNRDKRLEKMQHQLGVGIAGLANLTAELINTDMAKLDIIKNISEINQILLDLHYEETMNRRRLLIPMLDKSFISMIQGVKREKFLFGDNLGENIKTTKSIEKASRDIKRPQRQPFRRLANQPGNYQTPPRYASGTGVARAPATASRYYQPAAPALATPPATAAPPAPAARRPPPQPARRQPTSHAQSSRPHWQDRRSRR